MDVEVIPYELLARYGRLQDRGKIVGASVRRLTVIDGKEFESDPIPLAQAADDPAFAEFAEQFSADAVAQLLETRQELEAAKERIAEIERDANLLAASVADKDEQIASLKQSILAMEINPQASL